jgi:hypothetical protein
MAKHYVYPGIVAATNGIVHSTREDMNKILVVCYPDRISCTILESHGPDIQNHMDELRIVQSTIYPGHGMWILELMGPDEDDCKPRHPTLEELSYFSKHGTLWASDVETQDLP